MYINLLESDILIQARAIHCHEKAVLEKRYILRFSDSLPRASGLGNLTKNKAASPHQDKNTVAMAIQI